MGFTKTFTLSVLLLATLAGIGQAASPSPFPTTPGTTLLMRTTTRVDSKPPTSTETPGTVEAGPMIDQQATLLLDKKSIVAVKADGYYLLGKLGQGNKPELFAEPALLLPIAAKLGDKWVEKRPETTLSAACLGTERITVPAGTFDALKVYGAAAQNANERTEFTFWYAPEAGMVKRTASTQKVDPSGNLTTTEITDELLSYKLPGEKPLADNASAEERTARLFSEAEALAKAGKHEAALVKYDAALAIDPKAGKVLAYKAVTLTALRRLDEADRAIAAALAIHPKQYLYVEIAGQIKLARGQIEPGKALYDRAAELAPESAGAVYLDLAAALAARKDPNLALQVQGALEKSASAKPPHPDALFALGQSYISAGKIEGKTYLQRYLEAAGKLPEAQRDAQKMQLARQLIRAIDAVKGM